MYKALRDRVSEVAVKVLLTDASEDEDFRREVAILRSCRDSHVVQVREGRGLGAPRDPAGV